jgi:hypothetical protein
VVLTRVYLMELRKTKSTGFISGLETGGKGLGWKA